MATKRKTAKRTIAAKRTMLPKRKPAAKTAGARLRDTDVDVTDQALDACPVGALLRKRVGFAVPVGRRLYDKEPIGNRAEEDHT